MTAQPGAFSSRQRRFSTRIGSLHGSAGSRSSNELLSRVGIFTLLLGLGSPGANSRRHGIQCQHWISMSRSLRITGLLCLAGTLPWATRIVWEMTWLTWNQGPQMLGFTMWHTFPQLAIVGTLCWLATALWCLTVIVLRVSRRFKLASDDWVLVGANCLVLVCPTIPYGAWQSVTEMLLGTSPAAPYTLVSAASTGDLRSVAYLLRRGVSPDATDSQGCSALAVAAGSNTPEMVSLLIRHGANPNGWCKGEAALHRAARSGNLASVKLLLAAGADRSAQSADGFTAAELAWGAGHDDLSQLLDPAMKR